MAELHWFPAYVDKWMSSKAINAMLPEQEGAFWRLLLCCWGNGESEPSLPADDASLAQMSRLGSRWKKLGGLVRDQFEERGGKLYNEKLSEVWRDQQIKHGVAVANGRKGAKKRAENKRNRGEATSHPNDLLPEKTPISLAKPQHLEQEGTLVAPAALTSSPPATALGVGTPPRQPEMPVDRGRITNGKPDKLGALLDRFAAGLQPKVPA